MHGNWRFRWILDAEIKGPFPTHFGNAIITRIERQYGGSMCDGNLRSLLKLDRTNPFEPLKFLSSPGREISPISILGRPTSPAHDAPKRHSIRSVSHVRSRWLEEYKEGMG
jgi:hypothetical protein